MRRIQRSDLIKDDPSGTGQAGDARAFLARGDREAPCQVFWMTMFGNLAEKSSAFCATNTAVLRAISPYAFAIAPSGSEITVGRPESACSRMRMSSGSAPRNGTL